MDEPTPQSSSLGPIIATTIIVALFLVGGVYFILKQEQRNHELKLQNQQAELPANS